MIYIQSNNNIPHHLDAACVLYGAIDSGLKYELVTFDDVKYGKYDSIIRKSLFVGSVEFMKEVFSRIGKTNVRIYKNSNREFKKMKIYDVIKLYNTNKKKVFIKPFDIKVFTGLIIDDYSINTLLKYDNNIDVMVYEVFSEPIKSEWRCYILDNKLQDIKNYSGDIFTLPDREYIKSIIGENNDFPISYVIDVGILNNGENVVIEFNDMWAIGNYGIDNILYLRMLRQRYFQILST